MRFNETSYVKCQVVREILSKNISEVALGLHVNRRGKRSAYVCPRKRTTRSHPSPGCSVPDTAGCETNHVILSPGFADEPQGRYLFSLSFSQM